MMRLLIGLAGFLCLLCSSAGCAVLQNTVNTSPMLSHTALRVQIEMPCPMGKVKMQIELEEN